jgi:broad specificity phosphatase PhoE
MHSEVIFVRHAESEANANGRTVSPHSIPLSRRGEEQASAFADKFDQDLSLIVVTIDVRTLLTARHLIARFPGVPVQVWPLHEFTFLSPAKFEHTTVTERKKWVHEYWERCDPDFVDGNGAESFHQFVKRITDSFDSLKSMTQHRTLVFSHGHVMRLVKLMLDGALQSPSMIQYRDDLNRYKIPNLHVMVCDFGDTKMQTSFMVHRQL